MGTLTRKRGDLTNAQKKPKTKAVERVTAKGNKLITFIPVTIQERERLRVSAYEYIL